MSRMRDGLVKRGAGWTFKLELPRDPETGERRTTWLSGFATREDAKAARDDARAQVRRGTFAAPTQTTVGDYLPAWLAGRRVEETTRAQYRQSIDVYIVPRLGRVKLQALTAEHLDGLYRELERSGRRDGGGLAPKSVRHVHTVLRKALQDALERGHVARNVADLANPPTAKQARSRKPKDRVWTAAQLRAFLTHVAGDRLYAAWLLLATTGMRRGEVAGLPWRGVDLDGAVLTVVQTVSVVDDQLVWRSAAKTEAGERRIALDPATVAAVRAHRRRQAADQLAFGPAWVEHPRGPLVFTRPDGEALHPRSLLDTLGRRVRSAGLPAIDVHGIRHSYATAALRAGVSPEVLAARLGHAHVATTLSVYAHVRREDDEQAAAAVAASILGGAS